MKQFRFPITIFAAALFCVRDSVRTDGLPVSE